MTATQKAAFVDFVSTLSDTAERSGRVRRYKNSEVAAFALHQFVEKYQQEPDQLLLDLDPILKGEVDT